MQKRIDWIVAWIKKYAQEHNIESLVVGISGGIDSSVVSTLCAQTGIKTFVVTMPIRQASDQDDRSMQHGKWLTDNYINVGHCKFDLTYMFEQFERMMGDDDKLGLANSRARLRMTTLYQLASMHKGIVVGTGNKVEDFGVGFYTKYGDGGVDISPIGDCLKTEVWEMGQTLGIAQEIIDADPTDGLWDDGRTDEGQLGMTYAELEQAMHYQEQQIIPKDPKELDNYNKYVKLNTVNGHKMRSIPVCYVGEIK